MTRFADAFVTHDAAIFAAVGDDIEIDGVTVRGAFEEPYIGANVGNLRTGLNEPRFHAREADVAAMTEGKAVKHNGIDFDIVKIERAGEGITVLVLRQQA